MKLFITFFVYTIGKSISKFSFNQGSTDQNWFVPDRGGPRSLAFNMRMILLNTQIFSDIFKKDEDHNLLPNHHHHNFDPINQKLPQLDPRFPSGMDQSVATVFVRIPTVKLKIPGKLYF